MDEALKEDKTKPRLGLVPSSLIWGAAIIMTQAVQKGKYPENNWRLGMKWSTAYDALQRHLTKWNDGESIDPDSGKSHLLHAICELAFLVEYEEKGIGTDDRYKNVSQMSPKT